MRRYTSDLEFQPDEAAMRDADREFCRFGDQNSVRGPAFPFSQQGFRADAAVFFVGHRADDDITGERHALRRFQSQHTGSQSAFHIIGAAPEHAPVLDAWLEGRVHARYADHISMRVEHKRLAAAASAGDQNGIEASVTGILDMRFQAILSSPIGDEFSHGRFAGAARREVRIHRVDGDQIGKESS